MNGVKKTSWSGKNDRKTVLDEGRSELVGYQDAGVTDSTASLFEQIAVRASSGQRQDQNIVFQIVD